jgi:Icc-related predicted phosphoesterase
MGIWYFASDLHGQAKRYSKILASIADEKPAVVLLGGDLLPSGLTALRTDAKPQQDFIQDFLVPRFDKLRARLGSAYPRVLVILGNDDPRTEEDSLAQGAARGAWEYVHGRRASVDQYDVYGYACVPPTPFLLKDWERYDVSRHVDPGCVSPEEGHRTVPVGENQVRYGTIQEDLTVLFGDRSLERAVCLFHAPPYKTTLDRAALDGMKVDHAPLDVHVGSVAIRRFIEERQPLVTLHGHIHESARLTGSWREQIGRTHCFSAAHDGPELALVRFDPSNPAGATRDLL